VVVVGVKEKYEGRYMRGEMDMNERILMMETQYSVPQV
jgi:hypothetical protein